MFEFFAMIFTFGALFYEVNKSASKASQNKTEARKKGQKYYWDGSKRRSMETGEILIYHDGKLFGTKSNRAYVDFEQQRIDEDNEKRKRCGSPVYMGHCKKHYDSRSKSSSTYHLREKETNRMYNVCKFKVLDENGRIDETQFYIVYLDEDLKSTHELKKVPVELRFYYQGFYD